MKNDIKTIATILSALGVSLPVEPLSKLDTKEYLAQLDNILALAAGEHQQLGELLRAAKRITPEQLDVALAEQRQGHRKLGEILIGMGLFTQLEIDAVLEFQRRQDSMKPGSSKFALGNILVANGEITRAQVEEALRRQTKTGRRFGEELILAGYASRSQVEHGLFLQCKLIAYSLAAIVGLAPLAPSAEAASKSAAMSVSVTVIANAKLRTDYQATQLKITEADVARGYVNVQAASRFSVLTNSRAGYMMDINPVGNIFESVQVSGLGSAVQLGADGGTVVQRGPLLPDLTHELSYRFALNPEIRAGTYPWPLHLSVRAL